MGLKLFAPAVAALVLASPAQLAAPAASPLQRLVPRQSASKLAAPAASPLHRLVPRQSASPPPLPSASKFLQGQQQPGGGFAEATGPASPALTAWAVLGLAAAGKPSTSALGYLRDHESDPLPPATRALVALAAAALGDSGPARALPLSPPQTNTIIWTILARRQAGLTAPKSLVTTLVARQARSGGWGWDRKVVPDSNDTAAAVQALRAAGVSGASIRRALDFLRSVRAANGGFALVRGREPDAQSTAWAIQAFLAAGSRVPDRAFTFLRSLLRADGSYRYSRQYTATPVWVTAQVLPALVKKPFPLR